MSAQVHQNGVSSNNINESKCCANAKEKLKNSIVQVRGNNPYLAWDKKVPDTGTEKFKKTIEDKYNIQLETYWDLHKWSIDNCGKFWEEVWHYFDIIHSKPFDKVFEKTGEGFLDNKWFSGATLNYTENLLRIRDERTAIITLDEEDNYSETTYSQLYKEVQLYAAAFRKYGLQKGDRVCCCMNNRKEAVIAFLATASIGAMWSGLQPYYGAKSSAKIVQRMEPKFMITIDRFKVQATEVRLVDKLPSMVEDVPSLEKVIIITTLDETKNHDISYIKNSCRLHEFLESAKSPDGSVPDLIFEQLPFDHPLFLAFTSGTTGLPKGPVNAAGTFIPLLVDIALHWNLKPGDSICTVSPMGWAVWNWFIPCLALGVKLFLYSGCPLTPRKSGANYWDAVAQHKASFIFIEPNVLDCMDKMEVHPSPGSNLEHLKIISICGSPVKIQNIKFVQSKVKKDLFVGSLYGTTESHGFLSGFDLNLPLYAGEVQVPALGKDIHCYNSEGRSVIGELGELVFTNRCPSFPLYLWKDEDGSIMKKSYLSKFPGTWCPNDESWINPRTKGIIIVGRSDDVIVQHGECYGSGDIYFAIHDIEEVQDYICVSQDKYDGDVRAVLFVKLRENVRFTPELVEKIEEKIAKELWVGCVPELILEVTGVPYNINGKKMEGTIKKILATNEIPEVANIRNVECLKDYVDRPELVSYNVPL